MKERILSYLKEVFGDEIVLTAEAKVVDLNIVTEELINKLTEYVNSGLDDAYRNGYDQGYEDGIGIN